MPDFYPDALESGTINYPAAVSLGEGVLYLKSHMKENTEKLFRLTASLISGLAKIDGLKLYSEPNPFGIVTFNLSNMQSEETASALSEDYGICVRGGLHCAPLMHKALKSEGLVRASLSPFNSENEVNEFISAVKEISERNNDVSQQD